MNKKIAVIVAAVLVIGLLAGVVLIFGGIPGVNIGEPLVIDDNEDFETMGFAGNGSAVDPYIIEGLSISPNVLDDVDCIIIRDTTMFFIIRGCVLSTSHDADGIYLLNVRNGVVDGNTVSRGDYGIAVWESNNVNVTNNNISNCDWGLGILGSTSYNYAGNTYTNCFTDEVIQD